MTLIIIPENTVRYECLSTDIVDNKVSGASVKGARLYVTDTGLHYTILDNLTLAPLAIQNLGYVGRTATTVAPDAQATTNDFTLVEGSIIDALHYPFVSYTALNTDGANTISWKVLAGNAADLSDGVEVKAAADILATAVDSYSTAAAVWRYYGVYVESKVDETPGTAQVRGVAKG